MSAQDFTVIERTLLADPGISWKAKAILIYLQSNPDRRITKAELMRCGSEGKDAIQAGIDELEKAGRLPENYGRSSSVEVRKIRHSLPAPSAENPPFVNGSQEVRSAENPPFSPNEGREIRHSGELFKVESGGSAENPPFEGPEVRKIRHSQKLAKEREGDIRGRERKEEVGESEGKKEEGERGGKKGERVMSFSNSSIGTLSGMLQVFAEIDLCGVDVEHYFDEIRDWSLIKNPRRTENGWIATARTWMRRDKNDPKKGLKMKESLSGGPSEDDQLAKKYLNL